LRAAIVLSSADGVGTNEIMRRTGKSKTCVWRWQERFMKEGIDGLLPRLFSGWRIRLIAMRQCASETGTGIFSR
jgi:transposase